MSHPMDATMANFVFDDAMFWMMNELIVQNNLFVSLHMTGTSIPTQNDVAVNSGFTTPSEFNGANYTVGGYQVPGDEAIVDNPNDRAIARADELLIPNLGAGSAAIAGILFYRRVTTWSNSKPLMWVDQTASPSGTDFRIRFNGLAADGDFLRLKNKAA